MAESKTTIEVEDMITVGTLAERLSIPVTRLIGELMKNGVMASVRAIVRPRNSLFRPAARRPPISTDVMTIENVMIAVFMTAFRNTASLAALTKFRNQTNLGGVVETRFQRCRL